MFSTLELLIFGVLAGLFLIIYAWSEIIEPWNLRRQYKNKDVDGLFEEHEDVLETLDRLVQTQAKTNENLERLISVLEKGK